ncbi:hypothetical protein LINGRAHAP2_LOCUS27916 [Linum grandiflorum]
MHQILKAPKVNVPISCLRYQCQNSELIPMVFKIIFNSFGASTDWGEQE